MLYMKNLFNINYASKYFEDLSVRLEKDYRGIGRTDIELFFGDYQIIFECKVKNNYVGIEQNSKYLGCFGKRVKKKILCFLTQDVPSNRILTEMKRKQIEVCYFSWTDIIFILCKYKPNDTNKKVVEEFLSYYERTHKMRNIKEVLVQDLSNATEIKRFFDNKIYRTKPVNGTPLYFSPHFTVKAIEDAELIKRNINDTGIYYMAEIVGVMTGFAQDVFLQTERLDSFVELLKNVDEEEYKNNWKKGIKINNEKDKEYTFFFLGEILPLPKPIKKDGGIEKGRGKDWIAASVSKNRCIPFKEFIRRMADD